MSVGTDKYRVRVTGVTRVNDLVKLFRFERADGGLLPPFSGGAHTVVEMHDGELLRRNPYSLMSDPFDRAAYTISVRRDDEGRGGSLFMHQCVEPGMELTISNPVNLFPLDLRARKHLMLAGGIGITPFLAQIKELAALGGAFELHYACRNRPLASYAEELSDRHPGNVHVYHDDEGTRIDLGALLAGQPLGTHLYVCGPKGMIDWVRRTAAERGWPDEAVHHEEFLAPPPGKPFEVRLAASDKLVEVGEHESLLEAIERAGVDAPYLCRGGACGQCETRVIEHEGRLIHHDHWLDEEAHASGTRIMPCVSRFEGPMLVLDR